MAGGSFHVIIDQRVEVTLDLFLHCKVPHRLSPDDVWNLRSFLPSLGTKNSGLKKKTHKKLLYDLLARNTLVLESAFQK